MQGQQKFAVRVQVDPDKLQAQEIGLNEINQALQNWNVNLPTGQLFGRNATYNITASGQLMNAAAVPADRAWPTGTARRSGSSRSPTSSTASRTTSTASWLYTRRAAGCSARSTCRCTRQPGTNTIEVTDAIRALLPYFESLLPPSVHLIVRERSLARTSARRSRTSR